MSRILHLTLKKKWFDMIASGEKKEEYRELKKYWQKRLFPSGIGNAPKQFDIIRFKNGYSKEAAVMDVEWSGCWIGGGRHEWGGGTRSQFVIGVGKILSIKNYKTNENN